jgi:hypothetical protein
MLLARAFGGSSGRRESTSSDTEELEDEDEDTVENSTFITPLSRNDLTPRKSWSDLKLKSLPSRGEIKSPTFRVDLKSRVSRTNLKPKHSNADLKAQSPRGEVFPTHPPTNSGEDQDMRFRFIVQDRPVVVGLGLAAWRAQCLEMLESRQVVFQGKSSVQKLFTCLAHNALDRRRLIPSTACTPIARPQFVPRSLHTPCCPARLA